jgi:hypothetical protein
MDVARELPDNSFLIENNVKPGSQNTAIDQDMKDVAKKIIDMKNGDYGSRELSSTVGGCAMNTCRAANFCLQSQPEGALTKKVITLGSIGTDESADAIVKQLDREIIIH